MAVTAPPVGGELAACLEHLEQAIDAATALGLDATDAIDVRALARERLRFPGRTYVLALAGGTGVGKSSLLNALAGTEISAAGVRRPTTGEPVAWVPAAARAETAPLLAWLGITQVHEHTTAAFANVAILDLPDLDSVAAEHRARVDALLPRVDAVAWVADPEKYHDAVLHDGYVRSWGTRLGRQAVVVNKVDRLHRDDAERIRGDLARGLRSDGLAHIPVLLVSAAPPASADVSDHVARGELVGWLRADIEAKQVVAARVGASARAAVAALAAAAGVSPGAGSSGAGPLVTEERRSHAIRDVTAEVLRIVDLPGLERQAVQATRSAARPRGGGPIGRVWHRLYRLSGRADAHADPDAYLRRWRERGTLARAVEPIRTLVSEVLPTVPAGPRRALVAVAEPEPVRARLSEAVDAAVVAHDAHGGVPSSRAWPLIGAAQVVATGALVLGIVWIVALWAIGSAAVTTTEIPILGPVPQPVLLVGGALVAGFLLSRILDAHATWKGRRWASSLRRAMADEIDGRLARSVLLPLDAVESARERLAGAAAAAERECGAAPAAPRVGATTA